MIVGSRQKNTNQAPNKENHSGSWSTYQQQATSCSRWNAGKTGHGKKEHSDHGYIFLEFWTPMSMLVMGYPFTTHIMDISLRWITSLSMLKASGCDAGFHWKSPFPVSVLVQAWQVFGESEALARAGLCHVQIHDHGYGLCAPGSREISAILLDLNIACKVYGIYHGCAVHGHAQLLVVMDQVFPPTCLVFSHGCSDTVLEILWRVEGIRGGLF